MHIFVAEANYRPATMKNTLFVAALLVGATVTGCGKDKDREILEPLNLNLYAGDEYRIQSTAGFDEYVTDNDYIATVTDDGVIHAWTIGEAAVTAQNANAEQTVNIIVTPRYVFEEPCTDWTSTRNDIIREYGAPDATEGNMIAYNHAEGSVPLATMYAFDGDALIASFAMIEPSDAHAWIGFLSERYLTEPASSGIYMFVNAWKKENVTTLIGFQEHNDGSAYRTTYMPYHQSIKPTVSFGLLETWSSGIIRKPSTRR